MNPVLLLIVPLGAILSTPQPAPPAARQPAADQLDFTSETMRMTVPVTIGVHGPYRFVVDTGAERTVIARELADTLGLAAGGTVRVTAMAGSADVATAVIPSLSVGSATAGAALTGTRIEAPALVQRDLGAAGLVGIDTLKGHALTIDFATGTMTVVPATRRVRAARFGRDDIVIRARNLLGQLIVTDASYRGRKIRVVIDTGSAVSMGNLALRKIVAPRAAQTIPVRLLSVTGAVFKADYTQVDRITVASVGLDHLPVAFSDAPPFARLGLVERPALLLGMDALRLFGRVRIDFANREVRLAQPKAAGTF